MSYGSEPKPYEVWYKGDKVKSIKKGLHGSFKTEEEAQTARVGCIEWFNNRYGPNSVRSVIRVNEEALAKARADSNDDDGDDTTLEFGSSGSDTSAADACSMLIEQLVEGHDLEEKKARQIVRKHAKIAAAGLGDGISLKALRETAKAILNAQEETPAPRGNKELLARIAELERERDTWLESTPQDAVSATQLASSRP